MSKTKSNRPSRPREPAARSRPSAGVHATGLLPSATNALLADASQDDRDADRDSSEPPVESGQALKPMLVRASAGTGKTYRLTARLLKILLQGAAPETILATTFTRKAAGEILERVLSTLAQAADESNPAALDQLRQQVGIPTLPRVVCLQLLEKILRSIHRLRICTLDSLFSQLARSFPFELGLPPNWRLTDEIEELWLRERAVDNVISLLDKSEMVTVLSMLGKGDANRSIARELLRVVDTAYTIQRQSDRDAWSKLVAPTAPDPQRIADAVSLLRTVTPPQKRLLDRLRKLADQLESHDFAALDKDTLIGNIHRARLANANVTYYRSEFDPQCNQGFDVVYAAVRTHVLSLLCAQNEATGTVLAAYDHHVQQLKQASRVLGFEDVTVRLAQQFASLDPAVLSTRLDGSIDHVLLDEFQDTSPAQWQVIRPLAERSAAADDEAQPASGRDDWQVKRSFFCVGDTKQAIYGWRGGVAEIFNAVADQIAGISEDEQNTSFRSSPVILDVVNQTFRNLHRHPLAAGSTDLTEKTTHEALAIHRFAKHFPRHVAANDSLAGFVRVQTSREVKEGDDRELACVEDAATLAARIHRLAPATSIGILTRTNRGVAQMIYLLERLGIDVSQEGGNPLTDSAAVEVILSALMMAEHPGDRRWEFHARATALAELPEFGSELIRQLVEDRGLSETVEYLAGVIAPACNPRDTLRLKQLTRLAMTYQPVASPRLRDFVRLVREKRVERPQRAPVRVMTIHQAKGLEFDAVILPQFDGQLTRQSGHCVALVEELGKPPEAMTRYLNQKSWHFLPPRWQRAFGDQAGAAMTEALCLMYVAMTRAKQALHVIMQPANKPGFDARTPAALLYHALPCSEDPTQGSAILFEQGDPNWFQSESDASAAAVEPPQPVRQTAIQFRPLPAQPRRNRSAL
jgi:ATP-dependent exoDNAse (exonuclease V) beta subunit